MGRGHTEGIELLSRAGKVLWRYDLAAAGLGWWAWGGPRISRDGSTIYASLRHEDGSRGIWSIPLQNGDPRLLIAYDPARYDYLVILSEGPDHIYLTVGEYESDIWVMDVEVER